MIVRYIIFCVCSASALFELPQYSVMFSAAVDGNYLIRSSTGFYWEICA